MLAQTYNPASKPSKRAYTMPFPLFTQRKYDGIRCMCSYGNNGEIVFESRKGSAFQLLDHLKPAAQAALADRPRIVFDGELYTNQLTFETLSGLVRLTAAKAGPEARQKIAAIEYHIYDFYDPARPALPFGERKALLEAWLADDAALIRRVPTMEAHTQAEVKQQHDQFVQEGFEGIMLRDPAGPYELDKRSKYLQKYKEFLEEEFRIVGFHDGEGIDAGMVTWDCITADGRTFAAKPRGTFEQRRQWFAEAPQHVGKLLTVIFQEYSADGVPRFPIGKALRGDAIE
jgi:DNA ligase-1